MTAPEIRGWCPGALRPMLSGDGWLVRIRPPSGVLTPAQAAGVARAAAAHGNGVIDLTSRANLQLRGVREDRHADLIDDLRALDLIDPDEASETARNIIVTPFRDDPATEDLAAALTRALADAPDLPGKFGFAVDCGPRPVLSGAPADIRLERSASGTLLLRADGHPLGREVAPEAAVDAAVALARWFLDAGGATRGRGRMAALVARGAVPDGADTAPAAPLPPPGPGLCPEGALIGPAFGQMSAGLLADLADLGHDLRITPWRMFLLAGASVLPRIDGLVSDPADPLRRVVACPGAPGCAQGQGSTRDLARALACLVPEGRHLHVSGCAKGCAHPGAAALTLVATPLGYDLIRNGCASDRPQARAIPPQAIPAVLRGLDAPPL
jgi:precorrin-3B synthase